MIEIRKTAPEEYRAANATVGIALLHAPANDEDWGKAHVIPSWDESDTLSAWDRDRCVGHVGGYRFDTLVPGGTWLPTNGVTRVGVLGTHRRQGLLRRMMTQLLVEGAERGQVLASLRASETAIYQRFGFGLAGECAEASIVPARALPIRGAATAGSFRLLEPDEIIATVKPIYARAAARPGVISRPDWMWQRYFSNATELGGDGEFVVVHTSSDGVDDGFVHYMLKWKTANFTEAQGEGEVYDLWGTDPSIELALWDFLCNVDLVREWYLERPVDDVAQLAFADRRSYRIKHIWDEQWLRILDVDAALAARSYADHQAAFTVAVADDLLPANHGVWEISAAGAKRTSADAADADLSVDVGALSAVYLGGPKWTLLADATRVEVRDAAALRTADALFAVPARAVLLQRVLTRGRAKAPPPRTPSVVALRMGSKACPSSAPKSLTTVSVGHGVPQAHDPTAPGAEARTRTATFGCLPKLRSVGRRAEQLAEHRQAAVEAVGRVALGAALEPPLVGDDLRRHENAGDQPRPEIGIGHPGRPLADDVGGGLREALPHVLTHLLESLVTQQREALRHPRAVVLEDRRDRLVGGQEAGHQRLVSRPGAEHLGERGDRFVDLAVQHVGLGREIAEERARGDAGPIGDVVDRRRRVATLTEEVPRRFLDRLASRRLLAFPRGIRPSSIPQRRRLP